MQFSILEISIEIKTTTAVIKNELKYFLMYCVYSRAKPRGITLDMVQ